MLNPEKCNAMEITFRKINRPFSQLTVKKYIQGLVDFRKEFPGKIGLEVFPSKTNFLLVKSKIPDFAHKLFIKNVQIHDLSGYWLSDFYRITIGSFKENEILLNALFEIYINK